MAGFFDGEGYIGILKRQKKKEWNPEYFIQISIGQKDGAMMDWVKESFGGHLHLVKRDKSYYWVISNKAAYLFLKKIVPYLKYKRPQALKAIEFYEKKKLQRPVSIKELEWRELIYKEMQFLKHIFSPSILCSRAGSTTEREDTQMSGATV